MQIGAKNLWAAVLWTLLSTAAIAGAQTVPIAPPAMLAAGDQILASGDLIEISVFQTPELTTQARLDRSGAITMPEVGTMILAGKSVDDAERLIADRLRGYLRTPAVHVYVAEYSPQPITVSGAVRNPGVYSARSFPDLAAILAAAGGPTADSGNLVLIAPADPPLDAASPRPPVTVNLSDFTRGGSPQNIRLQPGDTVRVLPGAVVYVGGGVAKPGEFAIPTAGLTLLEAVSLAGGVLRGGDATRTRIVHDGGTPSASVDLVDTRHIQQGRAPDVPLRAFDLVYVPLSARRTTLFRGMEIALGAGTTIVTGLIVFH